MFAEQLSLAFEHLSAVLQYDSIDDFSIRGKNERYYKPRAKFPGANHIGILAATQGWRTEENMKTAKVAVKHAYEIMKDVDEYITFKKPTEFGGGFVGPFNYNWRRKPWRRSAGHCRLSRKLRRRPHFALRAGSASLSGRYNPV